MTDSELEGSGTDSPPPATDAVDEAYGMEARVTKCVKLPDSGTIPDQLKDQVRRAVLAHRRTHRLNNTFIAHATGMSESTVSEVLRGVYKADDSDLLRKLNAWLGDDAIRRKDGQPLGLYDTHVLISIRNAAFIAKKNARTSEGAIHNEKARIVMAVGPSGIGKSAGAAALAAADPNAILIRIKQKRGNDFGIIMAIFEACKLRDVPRSSKIEFLIKYLRHTGRLLIVDEAHRIAPGGYELLRDLADEAGIPILLLGTVVMQRKVDLPRMGIGKMMDEQFSRRVAYVVDLLRGSDGRGGSKRPFFTIDEIVAIFKSDQVRLTDDGAELLCAIACVIGGGMLGQAANVYEKAFKVARKNNGIIDAKLLWLACGKVFMAPGVEIPEIFGRIEAQLKANREIAAKHAKPIARTA